MLRSSPPSKYLRLLVRSMSAVTLLLFWGGPSWARADWGASWGELFWGVQALEVPLFPVFGQGFLTALLLMVAYVQLKKRPPLAAFLLVCALLVPAGAYAAQIVMPYVFSNGTVADADEVNANLGAIVYESNKQDVRLDLLEGTASTHDGRISVLEAAPLPGDITSVVAGFGLGGGSTSGDAWLYVDELVFQLRVSGACAAGSSIRAVGEDGSVVCELDDVGMAQSAADAAYVNATGDTITGNLAVNGVLSTTATANFNDVFWATNASWLSGDGGLVINQNAITLNSDGGANFGGGAIALAANGYASFANGDTYIASDGGICVGGVGTCNGVLFPDGRGQFPSVTITGGADIAEPFDIGESGGRVLPGAVVSIDPARAGELRLSDTPYDKKVAGIVSGAGGVDVGLILSQEDSAADGAHPVALTGRVYAWGDAGANGSIEPGDLLTTSGTPGHAMKATDDAQSRGAILGKAMTPLEHGRGLVLTLVTLQ